MRKLVIDTDCGLDDANAILLALSDPGTHVIGITTVDGNTCLENVVQNVLRVLRAADRLDIPVYRGSACSLLNLRKSKACHHGVDGLGDYEHHEPVDLGLVQPEHAVSALLKLSREHQGLELCCLGPLTNLAMAIRMDPNLGSRIRRVGIMGGNYKGQGNITMTSEFNFYCDPEAAHIVLSDLRDTDITLVGWEVCLENAAPFERVRKLMQADTKKATFMRNNCAKIMCHRKGPGIIFCDEVAIASLLFSEVVTESAKARFRVELSGSWSRGLAIPDWNRIGTDNRQPLVTMVTKFDVEKLMEFLKLCLQS